MEPPGEVATYPEESFKQFSEHLKGAHLRKFGNPPCTHCGKPPADNERFSKCARCKSMVYCSRQCQKRDWPSHKSSCGESEKQGDFIMKCILRISDRLEFVSCLGEALAEEFYELLIEEKSTKKMWIAAFHVSLVPHSEDLEQLKSPGIPIELLLSKPMFGRPMIFKFQDASNEKDFPIDKREHAMWHHTRSTLDETGCFDSHAMLTCFLYQGAIFFVASQAVHPKDLRDVGIGRVRSDVGDWKANMMQNPGIKRFNAAIALEDAKTKKFRCLMSDEDKRLIRFFSTPSAAR